MDTDGQKYYCLRIGIKDLLFKIKSRVYPCACDERNSRKSVQRIQSGECGPGLNAWHGWQQSMVLNALSM